MSTAECAHKDDLAAYALGALDELAEADLAAHLESCERCSAELRWLQPAIEALPESVEQLLPPPRLRERLVETVRAEAAVADKPVRSKNRRFWPRLGRLTLSPATGLATLLIVAAAVVGYQFRDGGGDQTRTVPVAAIPAGSTADLEIKNGQVTLQARHVPPLPPGSIYQVWVSKGGVVEPSSVFRPSANGSAAAAVPEALHGADEVLVTREPGRGSTVPSSAPIYAAKLKN